MVTVVSVNTAAIRIAYTFTRVRVTSRPSARVFASPEPECPEAAAMSPPPTAAATNIMPTNNRPLPRKTVAKKRSSCLPIRSLTTPMSHRNAIPANGTRLSAVATAALRRESVSHTPGWPGLAGVETRSRTSDVMRSTEKTIPATAAARGVRSGLPARSGSWAVGRPAFCRRAICRTGIFPSRTAVSVSASERQSGWAADHPRGVMRIPPVRPDPAGVEVRAGPRWPGACRPAGEVQPSTRKRAHMAIGPVQLLVLGFHQPDFHGEIIAELERLRESDTVRVIDSLAVYKDSGGELEGEHLSNLPEQEAVELGTTIGALLGLGLDGEQGLEAAPAARP